MRTSTSRAALPRWACFIALRAAALAAALAIAGAAPSHAQTFTGQNSSGLSAVAKFTAGAGNTLRVELSNTSLYGAELPAQVLTGLFFNSTSATNPDVASLVIAPGSFYIDGQGNPISADAPGLHWAYKEGFASSAVSQYGYGLATAGYGALGPGDLITQGPNAELDGLGYGVVSDLGPNPNGGVLGHWPYIQNTLVLTLNNWRGGAITDVRFQYGTSFTESWITVNKEGHQDTGGQVPEPSVMALFGAGTVGIVLSALRGRRRRA